MDETWLFSDLYDAIEGFGQSYDRPKKSTVPFGVFGKIQGYFFIVIIVSYFYLEFSHFEVESLNVGNLL